jgi:hypothetical protein
MSNSTNINDLPVAKENIQMTINDPVQMQQQQQQQQPPPLQQQPPPQISESQQNVSLDPNTINQIVNELHQATLSGSTKLASRDIPIDTLPIQQDVETSPNFVPEVSEERKNYIPDEDDLETIVKKQNIKTNHQNNIENMYNELQTPILLGVLYFLFQLPIFKKLLYQTFPSLFMNDGNLSINGYIFYSALFSIVFYFLNRLVGIFDTF